MPSVNYFDEIKRYSGSSPDAYVRFTCAHCDHTVMGLIVGFHDRKGVVRWLLCPNCLAPSCSLNGQQFPSRRSSPTIAGLPDTIRDAYEEARQCFSVNAFTACELVCRKILMHVAVQKGATEGETFVEYLNSLEQQGYITPPIRRWADLIRQHGNKSTHELAAPDQMRAEATLYFTAELLRIIYEMEFLAAKYDTSKSDSV